MKETKEIKLTIDGKEVRLTDEQLKMLGIEKDEARKNPFDRVEKGETYYCSCFDGTALAIIEEGDACDTREYDSADYFNDAQFAKRVALHQLLYRKLLKFAYDNECEDNQIWRGNGIEHWHIGYDFVKCVFYAGWVSNFKYNDVYFSTKEATERAIKEVVEPFMKEHPEFVW